MPVGHERFVPLSPGMSHDHPVSNHFTSLCRYGGKTGPKRPFLGKIWLIDEVFF